MTPELQQWYEDQFTLFNCTGYAALLETVSKMRSNYESLRNLKDEDDLRFRKGQLDILDWFTNWQNSVEQNYKDLQNEDAV